METVRFLTAGDTALTVEFGNEIRPQINAQVRALRLALAQSRIPGITETVPTYRSLTVHYRPEQIGFSALCDALRGLLDRLGEMQLPPAEVVEIPLLYGGEEGPDLAFVAEHCNRSVEEVIRIHSAPEYLIYMLGFTPGFPYLGGMDPAIATPRLTTPRVRIPGGSAGIAGDQTGIYPIDSPGGWQLIGRTPLRLYDPGRENPILLEAGQYLKFRPIDRSEYDEIARQVEQGTYRPRRYSKEGL